jgi:hypothetical protein
LLTSLTGYFTNLFYNDATATGHTQLNTLTATGNANLATTTVTDFTASGNTNLGKTTAGQVTVNNSLNLTDYHPDTTTNMLYNVSGTLYWNGSAVGSGGSSSSTYDGVFAGEVAMTDGKFSYSGKVGYSAANALCNATITGSHFCRTNEVIASIYFSDSIPGFGIAWIAQGPPGYTANSNDCTGWTSDDSQRLGAFWSYDSNGGGAGWLSPCDVLKPIACCK